MARTRPPRFDRLLALVPYFLARPGIEVTTAAAELGITPAQLRKDIEQLFVCGLPGDYPDDLIDIHYLEGHVQVVFAAGIERPLRLTGTEASVLLVALYTLLDAPGISDPAATRRAIAKIEQALGTHVPAVVAPATAPLSDDPVFGVLRAAVSQGRAIEIDYYTAARDEVSTRTVDPIRVQVVDDRTYLEAWCRSSRDRRLFRFDRVSRAVALEEPAQPPAAAVGAPPLRPDDAGGLRSVRVEVDPESFWLFEYYPATPDEEIAGVTHPVTGTLAYGSADWLARLLLGFGGRVRLIDGAGPDSGDSAAVARQLRDQAATALAHYTE